MLSLHQAIEIKESIIAYLKATFTFQDKTVHKAFYNFINHPSDGMFKGPYLSLKLRFVKANQEEIDQVPLEIKPSWQPYDHQVKAWNRLSTQSKNPEPAIVTTGTGSGKTEAFIYPILDYCFKNLHRPGIKVIILYPMNALATDQAKRLAEAIDEDERLRGKITAGLFIGEGKNITKYPKDMGADHIIENKNAILDSPPDILLTNFKMLDYGLMKAEYHNLWTFNLQDPELFRFLVLDELHTYDGAQGTDVANLIRRLKLKIGISPKQLCPVGTSATIGTGHEAPQLLADYASKIFGEAISTEAIITENRISPADFFGEDEDLEQFLPRTQKLKFTEFLANEEFDGFIKRQIAIWQLDERNLASSLRKQQIVKDLVKVCNLERGISTLEQIERGLSTINAAFKAIPQWDEADQFNPKRAIIESLFALIAEAKEQDERNSPFLYSQTQLWVRELSGIQRAFDEEPRFVWKDYVEETERCKALPPWFCRECGASGWLGLKHDNKERFENDVNDIYTKFFSNHKNIYFVNPASSLDVADFQDSGYEPTDIIQGFVYRKSLTIETQAAEGRIPILGTRKINTYNKSEHICPCCNTKNTVSIIGTKIATLSSIAVSQTLSTDLDPNTEKNRKVLAFTNSVQDAAHQAGFVEARNYRFTLRSSVQKVINQIGNPIKLNELGTAFIDYWKTNSDESGQNPLEAYYYRFYPKDYLGKSSPNDYSDNGVYDSHFIKEFDNRILWEIYAEFGYDSLIGRTLEKTGASGVYFDRLSLLQVWTIMENWLKVNDLSNTIKEAEFNKFLFLILHRIRTRGAIAHPFLEKYRTGDLRLWDLNWNKDWRHFLNKGFGPHTRLPKLISSQKETRGLLDSTFTQTTNWFHAYFRKSFPLAGNHTNMVNEFYEELVNSLLAAEIFDVKQANEIKNYALNPQSILVENTIHDIECDKCGHTIHTADPTYLGAGGLCLNYRCTGNYQPLNEGAAINYYESVYNRNRSPRIYAAEHTGLLERKQRELLEADFKYRKKANSKNTLVATSTLEMGIDIGTLNAAYNNSIPPLPSNFLQRIGRAGRSSGSALVVNFVRSQAHDLFYYQEPLDMMAGDIATPGCYLEAKEILRRHFFAYCIDSWTSIDYTSNRIPSMIRFLRLETQDMQAIDFFINRLINFVKSTEGSLFENFKNQYTGDVREGVFQELNGLIENESFYLFYKSIFIKLKEEIQFINSKRKELKERIEILKLGKEDPVRIELENEIKSLGGIISSIKKRNTLEYLTNVGALPNYAFPETGVVLAAKVLGNRANGSNKPPLNKDFEIIRSANQAIREFAPDNYFYTQGYRFQITGVNTFDWADSSNFHQKRFCSYCDHIHMNSIATKGNCPKCGHESWGAATNVHTFAKLISVKSYNNAASATLDDNSDDRERVIYHSNTHFDFNAKTSLGAWALKEIPFGIEFVKSVKICSTNLGRIDAIDARKVLINETEVPARGFVTCRHCGKSSTTINNPENFHYGFCKHKDNTYSGKADEIFEEVYFFREVTTEALKIILPVQELNSEAEVKMFKSGIELGLKKFYKGNPQHIATSEYKEYNPKTIRFDRYLILYDTVPGGTGYLEQLFDRNEFSKLLNQAYEAIRDCGCQHEGKDGCYRCIFSYGNQYYQSELSRKRAEKWFKDIVTKSEGWELQTGGLSDVASTGQIEESELEERFIRSLKKFASQDNLWDFQEVNDYGIICYVISYKTTDRSIVYYIRPQVNLGPNDGIEYHTRTDFLMICTEAILNGNDLRNDIQKIAVYLDGYQYHASEDHNRFENDFKKRSAINANPEYITWTLTWNDIERFDELFLDSKEQKNRKDTLAELLTEEGYKQSKNNLLAAIKSEMLSIADAQNNFERFLKHLEYPFKDNLSSLSWVTFLALFQKELFKPSFNPDRVNEVFNGSLPYETFCLINKTLNGLVQFQGVTDNNFFDLKTLINIEKQQIISKLFFKDLNHIDKHDWDLFWTCYNLIQSFEFSKSTDTLGKETSRENKQSDNSEAFSEILSYYEEQYHPILKSLYLKGQLNSPEDELALNSVLDEKGNVLAEAVLILKEIKVAIEPSSESDREVFLRMGFDIKSKSQLNEITL